MRQFNSSASPLEVHWEVSVIFSEDDKAARELFGGKSKSCEASFTLHRADAKNGGTLVSFLLRYTGATGTGKGRSFCLGLCVDLA